MEILTLSEVKSFSHIDYDADDGFLTELIQLAYDTAQDSINDFSLKIKSAKFNRKLKLFLLNMVVSMYDDRGVITDSAGEAKQHKLNYINSSMLLQLKYNKYSETDI